MTQTKAKQWINWFFKSKEGKWTLFQWPNLLLSVWIIFIFVNLFVHNQQLRQLQQAVLFTWAYTELVYGDSYFRKTLGAGVLVATVVGFFL